MDEHEWLQLPENLVINTESSVGNEIIHELEEGAALSGSRAQVPAVLGFCMPAFVARRYLCYSMSKSAN